MHARRNSTSLVARSLACASLLLALLPCSTLAAELEVVASTPDLGSIAEVVGGDRVHVKSLARGTEDPHFVDPRPSLVVVLNRADVLVEGGAELEIGWLPRLVEAARNGAIQPGSSGRILASEGVALLEVPTGALDRGMGDVHAAGNPHYLLDPRIAIQIAGHLAERFAALDPAGAAGYRANADAFAKHLGERISAWRERASSLEGRSVIAYHKTFEYLADWLGFQIEAYVEPKPGIPPDPRHVAALTARTEGRAGVLLLVSTHNPRRISEQVAARTGARMVVLPAMVGAEEGIADYETMIDRIVERLADARPAGAGS